MGLLNLFRKRDTATASLHSDLRPSPVEWRVRVARRTIIDGPDRLKVVGESFYQDHLWTVVSGHTGHHVRKDIEAMLVVEHGNPDDANAISVWISGGLVGHLAREDAAELRAGLMRLEAQHGTRITLPGVVVGGGSNHGRKGILAVFLDYSRAAFGLPRSEASQRHRPKATPTQRIAHAKSLGLVSRYEYLSPEDEARALLPGPNGLINARLERIRDRLLVVTPLGWINPRSRTAHRAGLYSFNLKGTAYQEAAAKAGRFTPGAFVRLVREPDNPHDPNAIAVFAEKGHSRAGYVSAVRARSLAKLMDEGVDLVGLSVRGDLAGVDGLVPRILVCERTLFEHLTRPS